MEPGRLVKLRVVDAAGKPVPKASVSPVGWKGNQAFQSVFRSNAKIQIPAKTDAAGVWEWTWAPDDTVKYWIDAKDFGHCETELVAGAAEQTVILKSEHRITGRVTDALTGKPIPIFTVMPIDVFGKNWLVAERSNGKVGKAGRLDFLADRTDIPQRLRVEATGYRTQTGVQFRVGDDSVRTQDFCLQPSTSVVGTVIDGIGHPAAKAEVFLGTPTEAADFRPFHESGSHKTITDEAGRFAFPDPGEPFIVVARSGTGYAQAEPPTDHRDAGNLQLRSWATVQGRFCDGGKAIAGATIYIQQVRLRDFDRPQVDTTMNVTTGPDGSFQFPQVPPGPVALRVLLGPWKDDGFRSGPSVPLDLQPGQKVMLDLGSGGARVTGKVKLFGKVPADLDCSYSLNYLVCREPGIAPPPEIAALGFDAREVGATPGC